MLFGGVDVGPRGRCKGSRLGLRVRGTSLELKDRSGEWREVAVGATVASETYGSAAVAAPKVRSLDTVVIDADGKWRF